MAHSLTNIVRVPADWVRPAHRDGFTVAYTAVGAVDRAPKGRWIPMVIGSSPAMRPVYALIEQAAPTAVSVLISGESGTGKELVAQTIHRLSRRAAFPFTPINLVAIPETLLESELFGHERGAFTGAVEQHPGCFELADGGRHVVIRVVCGVVAFIFLAFVKRPIVIEVLTRAQGA